MSFQPGDILCRKMFDTYPHLDHEVFVEYVRKAHKRNPLVPDIPEKSVIISPAGSNTTALVPDSVLRQPTADEQEDYVMAKLQNRYRMIVKKENGEEIT